MTQGVIKAVFIGSTSVGKTAILLRYQTGGYQETCATTGATGVELPIKYDKEEVKVTFWDTAGQEAFQGLAPLYIRGSHVVIYVFDLTNQTTFDDLSKWHHLVSESWDPTTPSVVVGNKIDIQNKIVVSSNQAFEWADSIGATYIETSALTGQNIECLFTEVARLVLDKQQIKEDPRPLPINGEDKGLICCKW